MCIEAVRRARFPIQNVSVKYCHVGLINNHHGECPQSSIRHHAKHGATFPQTLSSPDQIHKIIRTSVNNKISTSVKSTQRAEQSLTKKGPEITIGLVSHEQLRSVVCKTWFRYPRIGVNYIELHINTRSPPWYPSTCLENRHFQLRFRQCGLLRQ